MDPAAAVKWQNAFSPKKESARRGAAGAGCFYASGGRGVDLTGGKFPTRPKRVRRACRSIGGERPIGDRADQMEGKGGVCDRPAAAVRMPMRMRGTRHARYLQTLPQPYSYAAYLTQLYSYAEYAYAEYTYCRYYVGHNATATILRRYSLLQLYSTVDILYCSYTHITYS